MTLALVAAAIITRTTFGRRGTGKGTFQLTAHILNGTILFQKRRIEGLRLSRQLRHFALVKGRVGGRLLIQVLRQVLLSLTFPFQLEFFGRDALQLDFDLMLFIFQAFRLPTRNGGLRQGLVLFFRLLGQLEAQSGFRHGRTRRLTRIRLGRFRGFEQVL